VVCRQRLGKILHERKDNPQAPIRSLLDREPKLRDGMFCHMIQDLRFAIYEVAAISEQARKS
jgi:hypothetical protein